MVRVVLNNRKVLTAYYLNDHHRVRNAVVKACTHQNCINCSISIAVSIFAFTMDYLLISCLRALGEH